MEYVLDATGAKATINNIKWTSYTGKKSLHGLFKPSKQQPWAPLKAEGLKTNSLYAESMHHYGKYLDQRK